MSYFIGIDSSTTATKALLMAEDGSIVGVAASSYSFETPYPLWSEQQPALWWQATAESVQQVLTNTGISATQIGGVGLTGQMHGLVLLDEKGEVLRPSILWNDQRSGAECFSIQSVGRRCRLRRYLPLTSPQQGKSPAFAGLFFGRQL